MTTDEAREVFSRAFAHWPPTSAFRYFARRPRDGEVFGCAIMTVSELVKVTEWADKHGFNSYWQPNPTEKRNGTRCSTDDITHWCYFMVDIDPTEPNFIPEAFGYAAEDWMRTKFGELVFTLVYSGRGLQMLYPVGPVELDEVTRRQVPKAMGYWLDKMHKDLGEIGGCTVDTSCSDLPRVMRMPYTTNAKTSRRSTIVAPAPRPNVGLASALLDGVPAEVLAEVDAAPIAVQAAWAQYIPFLTRAGRLFITEGHGEPGRHRAAAAAMLSLYERGATEAQATSALLFGAMKCDPPLPEADVLSMVRRKYARG